MVFLSFLIDCGDLFQPALRGFDAIRTIAEEASALGRQNLGRANRAEVRLQ